MANVQRTYKDTVFRMLFGNNKKELLELYNAVNDSHYEYPEELEITTLEGAIFIGMKNDISFLIQDVLNLYEHQSTPNPNLPLRDLLYVADVLQKLVADVDLYTSTKQMIPVPRFIMFYNGTDDLSGVTEYRLSDLYKVKDSEPQLELVVRIININVDQKHDILTKCPTLREYLEFVQTVREFQRAGYPLKEAVTKAVDDCISRNILAEFLKKNKAEVIKVSIYEFDAKKHEAWIWKEGYGSGHGEGDLERVIAQVIKKVKKNKDFSAIVEELESTEEEIRPIFDAVLEYGTELPPEKIREKMGALQTV